MMLSVHLLYIRKLPTYSFRVHFSDTFLMSENIVTRGPRDVLPVLFPFLTHDEACEDSSSVSGKFNTPNLFSGAFFSSTPSLAFSSKGTTVLSNRRQSPNRCCLLVKIHSRLVAIIRVIWGKRAHTKRVNT